MVSFAPFTQSSPPVTPPASYPEAIPKDVVRSFVTSSPNHISFLAYQQKADGKAIRFLNYSML
jgi:hypothetical protein